MVPLIEEPDGTFGGAHSMAPIQDWFVAIFWYVYGIMWKMWYRTKDCCCGCMQSPFSEFPNGRTGHGMVVIIHGFKASVASFEHQRNLIAKEVEAYYPVVYSPFMRYEHNGSLETLARPIYDTMQFYAEANPQAPILIVGISAGGRVGMHLERWMRDHPNHVHLVTIGSPLHGTSVIYVSPRLARHVCGEDLMDEFDPDSLVHEDLHAENEYKPEHHTVFHFYSDTDWIVFPPRRCISNMGKNALIRKQPHNHLQSSPEVLGYLKRIEPGFSQQDFSKHFGD